MKTKKIKKINIWSEIPEKYTGIIELFDKPRRNFYWFENGKFHREDGPAVKLGCGTKKWYKHNKLHRGDGPAIEWDNGDKFWYKEGLLHREDGPAYEFSDGGKYWFLEAREYEQINIKDYVVLDHNKGKYGIMWYKLLDEDNIFEYPDILGLIEK